MKTALIVTDASPLITLAVADALDVLLKPGIPVIIPDMVRFDVVSQLDKPGANAVADWIRKNEPAKVQIGSTTVFEEFLVVRGVNPRARSADRGERASSEILDRELSGSMDAAILLFEDSDVRKTNFLVRIPDNVIIMSTSRFLHDLQQAKHIPSADAILRRAVAVRGKEILESHLKATGDAAAIAESWPATARKKR